MAGNSMKGKNKLNALKKKGMNKVRAARIAIAAKVAGRKAKRTTRKPRSRK